MFELVLTDGKEDTTLKFKVRETPIAKKWFLELCKDYTIFEDTRFSNWHLENKLIDELNQQIDIINQYQNVIDYRVSNITSCKELNYLHKFFEDLRGDIVLGTTWFDNAPVTVKKALEQFNILIHLLEENLRSPNHPTLVVTFKDRPRIELTEEDMKHFTFNWKKGTVYINYCHVGKPVLDVFKDKDKITSGARPQTHYSADFMIKFGPSTNYCFFLLRKCIINIWLKFQQTKFKNPNIGYIPVADIIEHFDIEEYRKFNRVKKVICIN